MSEILQWIVDAVTGIIPAIGTLIWDMFLTILQALFGLVVQIVNGLGAIPGADFIADAWNSLPWEMREMAYRLGVVECTSMIVGALVIRLILQLIPFVRLGS